MAKPTTNIETSMQFPEIDTDRPMPSRLLDPVEAARYIAEFTAELSHIARQSKLDLLTYLLDMARLEATRTANGD
jgi:hypothetical protein